MNSLISTKVLATLAIGSIVIASLTVKPFLSFAQSSGGSSGTMGAENAHPQSGSQSMDSGMLQDKSSRDGTMPKKKEGSSTGGVHHTNPDRAGTAKDSSKPASDHSVSGYETGTGSRPAGAAGQDGSGTRESQGSPTSGIGTETGSMNDKR
jgi:hypothetical protein